MSAQRSSTTSLVLHRARLYDALVWVLTRGRERQFRRAVLGHAALTSGQSVLDVGCGTGTLAILARDAVGAGGAVRGIDASAEMIARARRKAAVEGADATFDTASLDALPFPDSHFDAVLSTLMLHHLPADTRARGIEEVVRVLKPGGRLVAVDIAGAAGSAQAGAHNGSWRGFLSRRHGHHDYSFDDVAELLAGQGAEIADRGTIDSPRILGLSDLRYMVAVKPA